MHPDDQVPLRDRRYIALLVLATALAVPSSLVVLGFVAISNRGIHLLWEWLPEKLGGSGLPWPGVAVTTLGGLAVGLVVHRFPGHAGADPAAGHGLGEEDVAPDREPSPLTALGSAVTGVVSLSAGAALGPEAPAVGIVGNLARWLGSRVGLPAKAAHIITLSGLAAVIGGLFGSPLAAAILVLEGVPAAGAALTAVLLPALTASTVGYYLFVWLFDGAFATYRLPAYTGLEPSHLLWAVVLGATGAGAALAFVLCFRVVRRLAAPLDARPVVRGAVGGLALGLTAALFGGLVLFSGEHELQEVIDGNKGALALIALAVGKVLASSLSMAAGFRGGRIFPALFIGGTAGLALHAIFPSLPVAVAVACGMTAGGVATLRLPATVILIVAFFTSPALVPLMTIAAVTAAVLVQGLPDFTDPQPSGSASRAGELARDRGGK